MDWYSLEQIEEIVEEDDDYNDFWAMRILAHTRRINDRNAQMEDENDDSEYADGYPARSAGIENGEDCR